MGCNFINQNPNLMARLLRNQDYLKQIQSDNLNQVIESTESYRLEVEQAAQAEMISYLVQRYKTARVFTDTTVFDFFATYLGKNLIEYSGVTAFSAVTVYTTGQRVTQASNIYKSTAGSVAHAFNVAEWTLICPDKTLFYAKTNADEYSHTTNYVADNAVWYEDKVYTALGNTVGHLPTDTGYWSAGVAYSFTLAYPEDTAKWTRGDNRNQQIVMYLIDMTLYHLHSRINPRNVPELRMIRYDGNNPTQNGGAIGWLKRVASGDITADLESIIPEQGMSIRYGSNTKNINVY